MLVFVKRQMFESLDDDALGWTCIEPVIKSIRGKDFAVKSQAYSQLNKGQRALFMFRVFYNHACISLSDFYWWSSYYFAQPTWSEIKSGLVYFKDDIMYQLLEDMEGILEKKTIQGNKNTSEVAFNEIENDLELRSSVSLLYETFREIAPQTLKIIGTYIRNNPDEFIQFE
jgi:hypothetical protein